MVDYKSVFEVITHLRDYLPFLSLIFLPVLYERIDNLFFFICCILVSGVFTFLSSLCWLELRSRYLLEISYQSWFDNMSLKAIRLNIFSMIETVFGMKLAILLTIILSLNMLSMNSMVIKWYNISIIRYLTDLFRPQSTNSIENSVNYTRSLNVAHNNDSALSYKFKSFNTTFSLNELFMNLGFFLFLLIKLKYPKKQINTILAKNNLQNYRVSKQPSTIDHNYNKLCLELIWTTLSLASFIFMIVFPITINSDFSQNPIALSYETIFETIATLSSLFNILTVHEFTRITSKKLLKIENGQRLCGNFKSFFLKFSAFILAFALTTALNRKSVKTDRLIVRVLQCTAILMITANVCKFAFQQIKLPFDTFSILISTMLIRKYEIADIDVACSNQGDISTSDQASDSMLVSKQQTASKRLNPIKCMKPVILLGFMCATSLQQSLIVHSSIVEAYVQTYLLSNFTMLTLILAVRYFPYQIFNGLNGTLQHSQIDLMRLGSTRLDLDSMEIDSAFIQYKQELKRKLMDNKQLNIGPNQPKLSSAYKIIFLLILYCIFLLLDLTVVVLLDKPILLNVLISTICLLLVFLVIRQPQETIYVKYLYNRTVAVPYLNLILLSLTLALFFFFQFKSIFVIAFEACCFLVIILLFLMFGNRFNLIGIYFALVADNHDNNYEPTSRFNLVRSLIAKLHATKDTDHAVDNETMRTTNIEASLTISKTNLLDD